MLASEIFFLRKNKAISGNCYQCHYSDSLKNIFSFFHDAIVFWKSKFKQKNR